MTSFFINDKQPTVLNVMNDLKTIGFVCQWNRDGSRKGVWSNTSFALEEALIRRQDIQVRDIPISIPLPLDILASVAFRRYRHGIRYNRWLSHPWSLKLLTSAIRRAVGPQSDSEELLVIGAFGGGLRPMWHVQDFCYAHALHILERTGELPFGYHLLKLHDIQRCAEEQAKAYAVARGVFSLSTWHADFLRTSGLLDPQRVHVMNPGINAQITFESKDILSERQNSHERRLLFIGKEFHRKGGEEVLAAFEIARASSNVPLRLTIIGPSTWPIRCPIPENVDFLGRLPCEEIGTYLRKAHAFVMPSRFEAFGIVYAEALCAGLPVIARNDQVVPEIIDNGKTGILLDHPTAESLAEAMLRVTSDDTFLIRCADESFRARLRYTWDNAAAIVTNRIRTFQDLSQKNSSYFSEC